LVQKSFSFLVYLYGHHFVRYLFVGGSTFVIDFSILFVLHGKVGMSLSIATSVAYWTSLIYNFLLNRWWTFSAGENKDLRKHLLLYAVLLSFNYLFTLAFVDALSHSVNYLLAKALAVVIQMSWTYFVYKNIIFVSEPPAALSND
jgi:putative flippase GtrA